VEDVNLGVSERWQILKHGGSSIQQNKLTRCGKRLERDRETDRQRKTESDREKETESTRESTREI